MNSLPERFCPSPDELHRILSELEGARHFQTDGLISNSSGNAGLALISDNRIVKFGEAVSMREAAAMEYVRHNTTIPVPEVHFAFCHGNWGYIVMDFINAETPDNAQSLCSESQLLGVAGQLKEYIGQLRKLGGNQATIMGSWPSGPFRNVYFQESPPPHEFQTINEFRDYWIRRSPEGDSEAPELDHTTLVNEQVVLTHGDLSPRNILVKDGAIVAILDWETFGWYPSFWEYTFVYRGAWFRSWINALGPGLGQMPMAGNYYGYVINKAITGRF